MKITRSERKLIVICACALAVPLAVAAFIGHINKTPTIAATAPMKPPNPNGYDLYVAASNLIRPANPAVDANLDLKTVTDPKIRAQRYSLKRKDAWLAQNQAGFALFERAQKADSLAPPFDKSSYDNSKAIRRMARYKVIESNAHWQRGAHNRALQSGLDIAQLSYDMQRGGGITDYVTGNALQSLSRTTTSDVIEYLDAKQARAGARRIEKLLGSRWTLEQALSEERLRSEQDWLRKFDNPNWRADYFYYQILWFGPLTWKERVTQKTVSKRQIVDDTNRIYQNAIRNARTDYGTGVAWSLFPNNPFVSRLSNLLERYRFSEARELTGDRLLMLRLALRAHQLEHNAPPPDLQALVPNFIKAVPIDPFGKGAPLRYKTDGKNYRLWSIGPDGRDDSGKPIDWLKDAPKPYADEREKLPRLWTKDSLGDYVAGKNH